MTTCPSAVVLVAFAEGAGEQVARRTIETHLVTCLNCRERIRKERERIATVQRVVDRALAPRAAQDFPFIDGYQLLQQIGQGGMGDVYAASQLEPPRSVALKILRVCGESHRRLFESEFRVLARLHHPGIVQMYETGVVRGMPFFTMELIRGTPLLQHTEAHGLDRRSRLVLLATVCDAVEYAHQNDVVHRDLTPRNILVDHDGRAKIVDFGVAFAMSRDGDPPAGRDDTIVGTIPYMSPEQVDGDTSSLDHRSDIYSIGVIAYQLLAGRLPINLERASLQQASNLVRTCKPTPLGDIDARLRGDLATIVHRCLAKSPEHRYPSAAMLGQDIRNYLEHRPIAIEPQSLVTRMQRFVRRNRAFTSGVLCTSVALFLWLAHALLALQRERALVTELTAARDAMAMQVACDAFDDGDYVRARQVLNDVSLTRRHWLWRRLAWVSDRHDARWSVTDASVSVADTSEDGRWVFLGDVNGTVHLFDQELGQVIWREEIAGKAVAAVAVSSSGDWLAAAARDATVSIWRRRGTAYQPEDCDIRSGSALRFVDADRLVVGTHDNMLYVLDLAENRSRAATLTSGAIRHIHCETRIRFITVNGSGDAIGWHVERDTVVPEVRFYLGESIDALGAMDDHLLVARAGTLWQTCVAGETQRMFAIEEGVRTIAHFPKDARVSLGQSDGTVRIVDGGNGRCLVAFHGHSGTVRHLRVINSGERILSVSADGSVRTWDANERPARAGWRVGRPTRVLGLSDDDSILITCSHDRVYWWDAGSGRLLQSWWIRSADSLSLTAGQLVWPVLWIPARDGIARLDLDAVEIEMWPCAEVVKTLAVRSHDTVCTNASDTLLRLDAEQVGEIDPRGGMGVKWLWASDDSSFVIGVGHDFVRVWDASAASPIEQSLADCVVLTSAVSFRQSRLALGVSDGSIRLLDARSLDHLREYDAHDSTTALCLHPHERLLVSGGADGAVKLWDLDQHQCVRTWQFESAIDSVRFSQSGDTLAIATASGDLCVIRSSATAFSVPNGHDPALLRAVVSAYADNAFCEDLVDRFSRIAPTDRARALIRVAVHLGSNLPAIADRAWVRVRSANVATTDVQRAYARMQRVVALDPMNASYRNTLAMAAYRLGFFEEALEHVRFARENRHHIHDLIVLALIRAARDEHGDALVLRQEIARMANDGHADDYGVGLVRELEAILQAADR